MVTSLTKSRTQKLPKKIFMTVETYWHDHPLETSRGALSVNFSIRAINAFSEFFSKTSVLRELTLWTRRAAFASSKFPCLTIDGNADSRSTSAVFLTVCFTLFAQYFLLNPVVFDKIKSFFWLQGIVFGRHFVTFAIFSYQRGIYAQKRCFWWVNFKTSSYFAHSYLSNQH
jgi:hypothetical protein